MRARLPASAPEEPEPFSAILRDLDEVLLDGITHWQHPRYFAYFATSSSEPAILAELLAATLNSVAILWRTAPASTELEGVVLDWTAQLLGLPLSSLRSVRPRRRRLIRWGRSRTCARPPRPGCTWTRRTRVRRWSAPSFAGRSTEWIAPTRWWSTRTSGCSRRRTARCCGR